MVSKNNKSCLIKDPSHNNSWLVIESPATVCKIRLNATRVINHNFNVLYSLINSLMLRANKIQSRRKSRIYIKLIREINSSFLDTTTVIKHLVFLTRGLTS